MTGKCQASVRMRQCDLTLIRTLNSTNKALTSVTGRILPTISLLKMNVPSFFLRCSRLAVLVPNFSDFQKQTANFSPSCDFCANNLQSKLHSHIRSATDLHHSQQNCRHTQYQHPQEKCSTINQRCQRGQLHLLCQQNAKQHREILLVPLPI